MHEHYCLEQLWQFCRIGREPVSADVVVVLGSRLHQVASYAAQVSLLLKPTWIVCTGKGWPEDRGNRAEAQVFADICVAGGVPSAQILIEQEATSTIENINYSRRLLLKRGVYPKRVLLITHPVHERRALVTAQHWWSDAPEINIASPPVDIRRCLQVVGYNRLVCAIVAEVHRLQAYERFRLLPHVEIPNEVVRAAEWLHRRGYGRDVRQFEQRELPDPHQYLTV